MSASMNSNHSPWATRAPAFRAGAIRRPVVADDDLPLAPVQFIRSERVADPRYRLFQSLASFHAGITTERSTGLPLPTNGATTSLSLSLHRRDYPAFRRGLCFLVAHQPWR